MSLRLEERPEGIALEVRVTPRSQPQGLAGLRDGRLLVRIGAAPVDGEANAALVRLLADRLGVARGAIEIVGGQRSRTKRLLVRGLAAARLRELVEEQS